MTNLLARLTAWLEYLQGATTAPAPWLSTRAGLVLTAAWWVLLLCLIGAFSGQSSKFIYIDF